MTAGRLLSYTLDREREAGMQRILIVLWSGTPLASAYEQFCSS